MRGEQIVGKWKWASENVPPREDLMEEAEIEMMLSDEEISPHRQAARDLIEQAISLGMYSDYIYTI